MAIIPSYHSIRYTGYAVKGGGFTSYSDAQKEATARYNKKTYDRIAVVVKKGRKAEIVAFAQRQNKSVNRLIVDLLDDAMKKEGDA